MSAASEAKADRVRAWWAGLTKAERAEYEGEIRADAEADAHRGALPMAREFRRRDWPSVPAFFATVGPEVAEVRFVHDGALVATFDTSETWWRQDMLEVNGKVFLAGLTEDGEG